MIAPDAVIKDVVFRSETLGLDLARGPSDGHLPVLDSGIMAMVSIYRCLVEKSEHQAHLFDFMLGRLRDRAQFHR